MYVHHQKTVHKSQLLKFLFQHFCSGRSVCASIPPTIQRVLNSKACHGMWILYHICSVSVSRLIVIIGAIKFGDPLTLGECSQLVMSLSLCKLPFQCAHGRCVCSDMTCTVLVMYIVSDFSHLSYRPSLIPVLDLDQLKRRYPEQPLGNSVNIKKLRELRTKEK